MKATPSSFAAWREASAYSVSDGANFARRRRNPRRSIGETIIGVPPWARTRVDVLLDLVLVGGERSAGFRGDLLLVVVAELHDQPVAGFHHAEDFVQPAAADRIAIRFARLAVVGDRDLGFEPAREHLAPTVVRLLRLIAHRRIADAGKSSARSTGVDFDAHTAGCALLNSSVIASSHAHASCIVSRGAFNRTSPALMSPTAAIFGVRVFTMKDASAYRLAVVVCSFLRPSAGAARP